MACAAIAREVGAIHQLILMALSENEVVVQQACKTIGARSPYHLQMLSSVNVYTDVMLGACHAMIVPAHARVTCMHSTEAACLCATVQLA